MMKLKRYNLIPALLLIYLAVMAYMGRGMLTDGRQIEFFGIIAATLIAIGLLRIVLRKRDRHRRRNRLTGND
ncbi:MAG: hypothetical protein NC043_09480 [Muribaculaceae bacterium]|nr:hypothetical protein [Muribaculaceae bacterium]